MLRNYQVGALTYWFICYASSGYVEWWTPGY